MDVALIIMIVIACVVFVYGLILLHIDFVYNIPAFSMIILIIVAIILMAIFLK